MLHFWTPSSRDPQSAKLGLAPLFVEGGIQNGGAPPATYADETSGSSWSFQAEICF
jgi:hypothetical protein